VDHTSPEDFVDIFEQLNLAAAPYVVVSGVAVVLYGHVRSVADLDIVISPEPAEANRAMGALARAGFFPSIPLPLNMVSVMRMFDSEEREVDVFVRYYVPFPELWEASQLMKIGERQVRVISLQHLIQVKQTLGRSHDLTDIESLTALSA
jgi:hypothetical protein